MRDDLIKISMPIFEGKRIVNVSAKIKESQKQVLQEVCAKEDRTLSYVIGELAIRGLSLYKQDGQLKLTAEEEKVFATNGSPKTVATAKGKLKKLEPKKNVGT